MSRFPYLGEEGMVFVWHLGTLNSEYIHLSLSQFTVHLGKLEIEINILSETSHKEWELKLFICKKKWFSPD